jgi:dihydrofolate synthase/folylpolyglutamate synthase
MSYSETLDYLYSILPMFSKVGDAAIKKDLTNTLKLCSYLGNPHQQFRSVHVAGTNGKGSTSHMLAAVLQRSGQRTGLYTSPHLLDFRERIRINGSMVSQQFVVDFVARHREYIEQLKPSFFEVTVAMAFQHFAEEGVDLAVIETGLGGRLDSTNVISPLLSVITNISADHTHMLGDTLEAIAGEKAGIIKPGVPVVISEKEFPAAEVFMEKARSCNSPILFASDHWKVEPMERTNDRLAVKALRLEVSDDLAEGSSGEPLSISLDLPGTYQIKNLKGVLNAVDVLRDEGFTISDEALVAALAEVKSITGLRARWQTLSHEPLVICDTGHNEAGWQAVLDNLKQTTFNQLHMVVGVMKDKDIKKLLEILPKNAIYYFCNAAFDRALPAGELVEKARAHGLNGTSYPDVITAARDAWTKAGKQDCIFIGGSTFIVSEALPLFEPEL